MDSLEWEAFEHDHVVHSTDWFWMLGIGALSLAIISILFGNVIFAVLIVIAAITLGLHANRHPELGHYQIDHRGVIVNGFLYPYNTLESFWVEDGPGRDVRVILKSKKMFVPFIILPVEASIIPDTIRAYLLQNLPEVEHHESVFHALMERAGF